MSQFSLVAGERIRINNEMCLLRRKLDDTRWQLEKTINGEIFIMEESEILRQYAENAMKFVSDDLENLVDDKAVENRIERNFADYPEELRQEAEKRLQYVKSIENTTGRHAIEQVASKAQELGTDKPPYISTVYRWAVVFKKSRKNISKEERQKRVSPRCGIFRADHNLKR